ncbi:BEL1-like homeodomain protein 6 [Quillaja saponaria]|uniref:BEL1-like homeodomain protein 6 n=1 Tax=Quillaja saponaria TaxID=32244 RepID=A0AAD7PUH0_QUISA|nr:BEL1-like homeodomain protein 6 [Quillaja saponaria]
MAAYYASTSNERDAAPMLYLREPLPNSYSETPVISNSMMMYMNSAYSDALSGNSQQQNTCFAFPSIGASDSAPQEQEILTSLGGLRAGEHNFSAWREGRNEMLVSQAMGGQNLQGQGLSLSLGTQIPSGIQMTSIPCRNPNPGFASFLSPNPSISGEGGCKNGSSRDEQSRNAEYLPPGYPGSNQDSNREDFSLYGMSSVAKTIPNSKYLKAAQQLLDEVVNVQKALKQSDSKKNQITYDHHGKSSKESDEGLVNETAPASGVSSNLQESASNSPSELSHAEKQDLQNKLTKLLSMLDEVDRRYKQYYHQMQIVVSSFDVISGTGAAKPYTALALQAISRHFRCLRDAITGQILATRKSLGDQDASGNSKGVGITRLRYVDQKLQQQRALQQLGMMQQHAWRPQRGLPESSVSVLRAWLFEHFLHPYPKDSDKIMLARQTGLTRSQVSNWFINARVRLWKPMVEEMYKEEAGDVDMDSNSSSENAAKATNGDMGTSEDRGEDLQQCQSSTASERCSIGQFMDPKADHVPDVEMTGSTGLPSFYNGNHEGETEYGLVKHTEEQRPHVDDCNSFRDTVVHSGGGSDRFIAAAAAAYHMSEFGRFGPGTGVSLTLGLQHCEGGNLPMSSGPHHSFVAMREDDIYNAAASSIGADTAELECMSSANQQQRFSSSHLLHDFVVQR